MRSRSGGYRYDLPLVDRVPGEFLLTFEADQGKRSAGCDVRFSVK
jgi:hypothetical protein